MDGARAIGDQQSNVRDFARFARLGDETHFAAHASANEMMMDSGHSERRRNWRVVGIDTAVTENEDAAMRFNRFTR